MANTPVTTNTTFRLLGPRSASDAPPLWQARATLLAWRTATQGTEHNWDSQAARNLFIDREPTSVGGLSVHVPRTMVVCCRIFRARLNLDGRVHRWSSADGIDVTLLIEADRWLGFGGNLRLEQAICVGGVIPLDAFTPADDSWREHVPDLHGPPAVDSLLPAGVSLTGQARLPWLDSDLPVAGYLLQVREPPATAPLLLSLDRERLGEFPEAVAFLRQAFTAIAGALSAASTPPELGRRPRWLGLELADPAALPGFAWELTPRQAGAAVSRFRFDEGQWRLIFADQPTHLTGVSPRGVLTATPEVSIARQAGSLAVRVHGDVEAIRVPIRVPFAGTLPTPLPAALDGRLSVEGSMLVWKGPFPDDEARRALRDLTTNPSLAPAINALLAEVEGSGAAVYTFGPEGGGFAEAVEFQRVDLGYDPVAAAGLLREQYGVPAPESLLARVESPVLWGFVPLEDGWAELPVLNLTEQILLDVLPPPPPRVRPLVALLAGAASFGNDRPELFDPASGEQPWSATLLDADGYDGTFTLAPDGLRNWALRAVELRFIRPEVSLNGFLWLGTEPPSTADALSTLDNWLAGVTALSLKSPSPDDPTPSPFLLSFETLSFKAASAGLANYTTASLGVATFRYAANDLSDTASVYTTLLTNPGSPFARPDLWQGRSPLVWRRHPIAPFVQNLPLTQTKRPPNYPSRSRQLAPFELTFTAAPPGGVPHPGSWRFTSANARAWPRLADRADAATDWRASGLAMASLGLPGLLLGPTAAAGLIQSADEPFLPAQLRHGLPYLDERYALASLPPPDGADVPTPPPPPAPRREDLASLWQELSLLADFAAADADDALSRDTVTQVGGLVEPFLWPVDTELVFRPFPGRITLRDHTNGSPLVLTGRDALRGFHGRFALQGDSLRLDAAAADGFTVTAGSMAAYRGSDGRLRDQRGLLRGPTGAGSRLLATPVEDDRAALELLSALQNTDLSLPGGSSWQLWFRDLPSVGRAFERTTLTRSEHRRGVNDPGALSRDFVHRTGYEWRLSTNAPLPVPDAAALFLGPLHFYPLNLEVVRADANGNVTEVQIVGRLQLPRADGPGEQAERGNAVRLTFTVSGGHLTLTSVRVEPPEGDPGGGTLPPAQGEWPLATAADAPEFRWDELRFDAATGVLTAFGRPSYTHLATIWTLPRKGIAFNLAAPQPTAVLTYDANELGSTEADPIAVRSVVVTLQFPEGRHTVEQTWRFRWGEPTELVLEADLRLSLLGSIAGTPELRARLRHAGQALELNLAGTAAPRLETGAIQLRWSGSLTAGTAKYQLLPGLHLSADPARAVAGLGALAFGLRERPGDLPEGTVRCAFLEALFACSWGEPLQEAVVGQPASLGRVFGSSSGSLDAAYTSQFRVAAPWDTRLTLNGVLEVKNLISWPRKLLVDAADPNRDNLFEVPATRPAAGNAPRLDHVRHTARVLFDQQTVPGAVLRGSADPNIFLEIAPGRVWQPLVVVEHQLAAVVCNDPTAAALAVDSIPGDRRWATTQEVRFLPPALLRDLLLAIDQRNTTAPRINAAGNLWETVSLDLADHGIHARTLLRLLADPDHDDGVQSELLRLQNALIVEASAHVLVRQGATPGDAWSDLQYLPQGTQQGILTMPTDLEAGGGDWLLLPLPFLGRLQPTANDALTPGAPAPSSGLQVDPVFLIDRVRRNPAPPDFPPVSLALACRADHDPSQVALAQFDLAAERHFERLDPSALREGWFRLNRPLPSQTAPPTLTSVLVTGTSVTGPGRLGRSEMLERLFDPRRPGVPPRPAAPGQPPLADPDDLARRIVWRPGRLFVLQAGSASYNLAGPHSPPSRAVLERYPFLVAGAQFEESGFHPFSGNLRRHPAVTVLPADSGDHLQPVGFAVSPYLGLALRARRASATRLLLLTELLCQDSTGRAVTVVASRLWQEGQGSDGDVLSWARSSHAALAVDSPIAVVRLREIFRANPADGVGVAVGYRFLVVDQLAVPVPLAKRALPLRATPVALRFADGQFAGITLPQAPVRFELAPPQVRGVQPLYLERDDPGGHPDWPWGWSGLRLSVWYTDGAVGVAGPAAPARLWWQALSHPVQFQLPDPARRKVLPALFRARAISSLLPAWPGVLLPPPEALSLTGWQPILPGGRRTLVVGGRPGAPFALREHLLMQSVAAGNQRSWASGSVPVQHRLPRPVELPKNRIGEQPVALRTWGSSFDWDAGQPGSNHRLSADPIDQVYQATTPPRGLELTLTDPAPGRPSGGVLPPDWDLKLGFQVTQRGTAAAWLPANLTVPVRLTDGSTAFRYVPETLAADRWLFRPDAGEGDRLRQWLSSKAHGADAVVRVTVGPDAGFVITGLRHELTFPVRVARAGRSALPLRPRYVLFEDPEYSRALASQTAQVTAIVNIAAGQSDAVTLAADRREYNSTGRIFFAFFRAPKSPPPPPLAGRVEISRIGADGVVKLLPGGTIPALAEARLPDEPFTNLLTIRGSEPLGAGDALQITLTLPNVQPIALRVDIVTRPVLPVPEAAYALRRVTGTDAQAVTECARFAWGPEPERVELINPDDLMRAVVRRSAFFRWLDTFRPSRDVAYAVQKISATGSTHLD